jgi:hypothetical protein
MNIDEQLRIQPLEALMIIANDTNAPSKRKK